MRRRIWWIAVLLCSLVVLALTWAGGCLVAGHDSPSSQCFAASAIEPVVGFDPEEHVDDPIEAWQLSESHFTVWPTGLSCTCLNSTTGDSGTDRYITRGPSVAVLLFALSTTACFIGALAPPVDGIHQRSSTDRPRDGRSLSGPRDR